jgi:hypothetical protein
VNRACALTLLTFAPVATASEPQEARLVYAQGPGSEGCPRESVLRAEVAARLGYDPFTPSAGRSVRVSVARAGATYHGHLGLYDPSGSLSGERRLEAAHCGELVSSLAVAAAMGIDPFAFERPHTPAPVPAPAPSESAFAPTPPSALATPEARAETPSPARTPAGDAGGELRFGAFAAGLGSLGTAPAVAAGALVGVELRGRASSVALEGRADAPASTSTPYGEVTSSLLLGSIVPCLWLRPVGVCLVGSVGAIRGEGSAVAFPARASGAYGAVGARAMVQFELSKAIWLRPLFEVDAPITRMTLRLQGFDAWTTPAVSATLGLAAGATFL